MKKSRKKVAKRLPGTGPEDDLNMKWTAETMTAGGTLEGLHAKLRAVLMAGTNLATCTKNYRDFPNDAHALALHRAWGDMLATRAEVCAFDPNRSEMWLACSLAGSGTTHTATKK